MKKFLATLMTLALLLTSAAGLAETVPEINWEMVDIESTGIEGDWYTLNAVALQIWIPDTFEAAEITEEFRPGHSRTLSDADISAKLRKLEEQYHRVAEGIRRYENG